jgi:hypothetical protein
MAAYVVAMVLTMSANERGLEGLAPNRRHSTLGARYFLALRLVAIIQAVLPTHRFNAKLARTELQSGDKKCNPRAFG